MNNKSYRDRTTLTWPDTRVTYNSLNIASLQRDLVRDVSVTYCSPFNMERPLLDSVLLTERDTNMTSPPSHGVTMAHFLYNLRTYN